MIIALYQKWRYSKTFRKRNAFQILSSEESIDYIVRHNCSIARFGDGEFKLAMNYVYGVNKNGIGFQEYDELLGQKLYNILSSCDPKYKVGLPSPIFGKRLGRMTPFARNYWKEQCMKYINWLYLNVDRRQLFLDSFFTRFYIDYTNHSECKQYIYNLKRIWDGRRLIIAEGALTRLGIGNDLFDNSISIQRIICPANNAFCKIDEIESTIIDLKKNRDALVLVALGPTATVIAVDLARLGIQTIDIGHIDIEYEWMLRNATKKIPIPGKYVNEARSNSAFIPVNSLEYEQQIVAVIS